MRVRETAAPIERRAMRFLAGRDRLLDERIETGRIVDGRLRWGEGLDDVAPTCP